METSSQLTEFEFFNIISMIAIFPAHSRVSDRGYASCIQIHSIQTREIFWSIVARWPGLIYCAPLQSCVEGLDAVEILFATPTKGAPILQPDTCLDSKSGFTRLSRILAGDVEVILLPLYRIGSRFIIQYNSPQVLGTLYMSSKKK